MQAREQDIHAGVTRAQNRKRVKRITKFHPGKALEIVERIAAGQTLRSICTPQNRMPSKATFLKWVATHPQLREAYEAAQMLSALDMEEEALDLSRAATASSRTQNELRAAQMLIEQLRWSATRRDPKKYSDKGNQAVVVPIQITTSLDMASDASIAAGGTPEYPNIYGLTAKLEAPKENPDATEPIDAEFTELGGHGTGPSPVAGIDLSADDDGVASVFDPDAHREQLRREVSERFERIRAKRHEKWEKERK